MSDMPAALLSVWGTSAHDVWSVGGDANDGHGPYVLHYDGTGWTRLETGTRGDLWWVHGFEDGPIFMGGSRGTILEYDDDHFTKMPTPDAAGTVFGIWGISPEQLWAVGGRPDESGFIWRRAGEGWEPANLDPDLIATQAVFKVWGRDAAELCFVGARGLSLRFDGDHFERLETGTDQLLFTVHSDGGSFVAVGGRDNGVILEEGPDGWRDVAPASAPPLNGVAERDGRAYAVGANGEVLTRRDGTWMRLETGLDLRRDLHSVWIDPEGGVWSAGGHLTGTPLVQGVLVHGSGANPTARLGRDAPEGTECTRDGQCDDEIFCNGDELCIKGYCALGKQPSCDDGVECTSDACDEGRWGCRHEAPDQDGDGHGDPACVGSDGASLGDDCDDADPSRYPGAEEVCDALDEDEDCTLDTVGKLDEDGDGVVSSSCCNVEAHRSQCGADCDDIDPLTYPGATEACDGRDNDCDGQIDEGLAQAFYVDADGDGYGIESGAPTQACRAPRGYASRSGDCDDAERSVHPDAVDVCDAEQVDQDCDGVANDPSGGCRCAPGSEQPCPLPGLCAGSQQVCGGDGVWSVRCTVFPEAEACNAVDDDCDGAIDEDATGDCYPDEDADGYAPSGIAAQRMCLDLAPNAVTAGCPEGWTARVPEGLDADCDPTDSTRSPAADEICNGGDDDCDGMTDEGWPLVQRYLDVDGDGYPGTPVLRCADDAASANAATDCMDDQALVHPNQDGFFSNPACPSGTQACDAGATWHCRASAGDACTTSLASARWDYNCDDVDEQTEPAPATCGSGACSNGCGPSGFQPSASAQCGELQPYQTCRCLGAQGGGCDGAVQMLPMTCR